VGGLPRLRYATTITCFFLFGAFATYEAVRGLPSCGCFGNLKMPPAITAIVDFLAVIILLLTNRHASPNLSRPSLPSLLCGIAFFLFGSIALWTGYFVWVQATASELDSASIPLSDNLVVLEPGSWLKKPFGLFDEIEGSKQLRQGRWFIVFYHYDCDSCRQAIPLYASLSVPLNVTAVNRPKVAFVVMPPLAPAGQDPVVPFKDYPRLTLRPDKDWFATTPVVAAIDEGNVVWAGDGENAVHPPIIPGW
jgi:hypothetical protein